MTVLFAVLDGVVFGCTVSVLPSAIQDILTNNEDENEGDKEVNTSSIILTLMLCTVLYNLGKAFTAFINTISLTKSSAVSLFLTGICLITFSFTSSTIWLLCLRLILGLLSGYLGYFFNLDRVYGRTRSSWLLAAGVSASTTSALYGSDCHQSQLLNNAPHFFHSHPLFASFLFLAVGVVMFFILFVFSEKFGFIDDEDERVYSSYIPVQSHNPKSSDGKFSFMESSFSDDGGDISATIMSSRSNKIRSGSGERLINPGSCSEGNTDDSSDFTDLQVPGRYIRGCQGDRTEALRRWRETLAWRREQRVDNILNEPQPNFFEIKKFYPQYFHGKSIPGNYPVYYEQLGKINLSSMRERGITVADLLRHYIFLAEYLWTHVEPDYEHGKSITVLDVGGVSVGDLVGDPLDFLKESSKLIQDHYVERSQKIFVVNASYMFSWLWRMVQPMINENTRQKISILSSDMTELANYVGKETLPEQYGGNPGSLELGQSEEERQLAMFVNKLNSAQGQGELGQRQEEVQSENSNNSTITYGSVVSSTPPSPSSTSTDRAPVPRSLSRAANSRRMRMSRGGPKKKRGYNKLNKRDNKKRDTDEEDSDKYELGYSSSDDSESDPEIGDSSSYDKHSSSDNESFNISLVPAFMTNFYDSSVQSLKRVLNTSNRSEGENAHTAYLGKENRFVYEGGKWVEVNSKRKKGKSKRKLKHSVDDNDKSLDMTRPDVEESEESCDDTSIIRAIHASQGYSSEDGGESDASEHFERPQRGIMPLTRRLRRSFRRHITMKKKEALSNVSWWSWLHWMWRASLFISLEAFPALMLLKSEYGGMGYPPLFLGCCVLLGTVTIWGIQSALVKGDEMPSPGFFKRSFGLSLLAEALSFIGLMILYMSFETNSEDDDIIDSKTSLKYALLSCCLGLSFTSLLFSFGTTTLFTSAVMTSYKSPLHMPFSRSKAHVADAVGSVMGLLLLLIAHSNNVSPVAVSIIVLAITTFIHFSITLFNCCNPNAAGKGVNLDKLQW